MSSDHIIRKHLAMEKPQGIFRKKAIGVETIGKERGRIAFVGYSLEDLKDKVAKEFNLAPPVRIFSYEGDKEITDDEQFFRLDKREILVAATNTEDLEKKILLEERTKKQQQQVHKTEFFYNTSRYFALQWSERDDAINQEELSPKEREFKLMKSLAKLFLDVTNPNDPVDFDEERLNDFASEMLSQLNDTNEECPIEKAQ